MNNVRRIDTIMKMVDSENEYSIEDILLQYLMGRSEKVIIGKDRYVECLLSSCIDDNKRLLIVYGSDGTGKEIVVEQTARVLENIRSSGEQALPKGILRMTITDVSSLASLLNVSSLDLAEEVIEFCINNDYIMYAGSLSSTAMGHVRDEEGVITYSSVINRAIAELGLKAVFTQNTDKRISVIPDALEDNIGAVVVKEASVDESVKIAEIEISNDAYLSKLGVTPERIRGMYDAYIKCGGYEEHCPGNFIDYVEHTLRHKVVGDMMVKANGGQAKGLDEYLDTLVVDVEDSEIKDDQVIDIKQLRDLPNRVKEKIIGQDDAVESIVHEIQKGKLGVSNENRPIATLMFVGPTGVGKTELCRVLSKEIKDVDMKFLKLDMSEYSGEIGLSKLIGSGPGYVGYGDGGILTNYISENPNSIVLLDEIEKADAKIFNLLLQVMEDGILTDGKGNIIDFTKTIIVMTSNCGCKLISSDRETMGFNSVKYSSMADTLIEDELKKTFNPEFLNRVDEVITFRSLSRTDALKITAILMEDLRERFKAKNINLIFPDEVVKLVSDEGYSEEYGARNLKRTIRKKVENLIVDKLLDGKIEYGKEYTATLYGKRIDLV